MCTSSLVAQGGCPARWLSTDTFCALAHAYTKMCSAGYALGREDRLGFASQTSSAWCETGRGVASERAAVSKKLRECTSVWALAAAAGLCAVLAAVWVHGSLLGSALTASCSEQCLGNAGLRADTRQRSVELRGSFKGSFTMRDAGCCAGSASCSRRGPAAGVQRVLPAGLMTSCSRSFP